MDKSSFFKVRVWCTALVAITIWSLLGYQQYHGGVPIHHILADETLPSFSNWWGALLLPALTWLLLSRVEKRAFYNPSTSSSLQHALYGLAGALLFGVVLSVFFTVGNTEVPGFMLLGVFALALLIPVYRAQCLLGFVLGMTFTFGAVLPTGIGLILSGITAVLYLVVRPSFLYIFSKLLPKRSPQA